MKKITGIVTVLLAALTVFCAASVTSFAAAKQGWVSEDGKERYYDNGNYLTGKQKIGEYDYVFGDDGNFIGMYDEVIGTKGTADTSAYLTAVKAKTLLSAYTINAGTDKYNSAAIPSGGMRIPTSGTETSSRAVASGTKNTGSLSVVIKESYAEFVPKKKGDNSNLAVRVVDSQNATDCYLNINLDKNTTNNPAGADIVYEAEYKLGEDYAVVSSINLLQIIDRTGSETVFNALLRINANGTVVANNEAGVVLCRLNSYDYTRISVAIHPSTNSFDVYVNGILVKAGFAYYTGSAKKPTDIQIGEFRTLQFSGSSVYQGSVYADNIFAYRASEPVCVDTTTPVRNGVYQDGAYLRYYKNNLPQSGTFAVTGTFFGKTMKDELIVFSSDSYRAFIGYTAKVTVDGATVSENVVEDNIFIAPAAVDMAGGKTFIGWKVTDAKGNMKLLSVGDRLRISDNVTAEAVGVELKMLDGASVRTVQDSSGLRFIAKLSKSDYDSIKALGGTVEAHMLIVPTEYFDHTYGYVTVEALEASGYTERIDIKETEWYQTTDNYYYFAGSVANIKEENYMLEYSGVAYLKITVPGSDPVSVYSAYSKEANSRSVYYVASRAYEDRSTESGYAGYTNKVNTNGSDSFSPYSSEKLGVIKSMMDNVIMISTDDTGAKTEGRFYTAPYTVTANETATGFDISVTAKDSGWTLSKALGVVLNGEVLENTAYLKTSDNCTLFVGNGITGLNPGAEEGIGAKTWYFMNTSRDTIANASKSFLPENAPTGESNGYKWSYSKSSITFTSDSFGYDPVRTTNHYSKNGSYWDLSDWKSLTFYYYIEQQYVGATAEFLFYSENPSTDGIDYYACLCKFNAPGWNKITINKTSLGASRTPLGWDKITSISMTSTGWSQENNTSAEVYFSSFEFSDTEVSVSDVKLNSIKKLNGAAAFAVGGYAGAIDGELYAANPKDTDAKAFVENGIYYVPVNVFAAALDEDAVYYSTGNILRFTDGSDYEFREGKTYKKDGKSVSLKYPAKTNGAALFVSTEDAMEIFGYSECFIDRMGLIVLSDTKNIFDSTADYDTIASIINECIYVRPNGEKVVDDLNAYCGGVHPYILLTQDDFDRLNYYKKMDKTLAGYIKSFEGSYGVNSNNYKATPVDYEIPDGQRLLNISRSAMGRCTAWALLYKIYEFDDPASAKLIAERVWKELEAISHFQDWHPSHYLDTAELAYPVAIAYDWMYDYWSAEQKAVIEGMLYGFSLKTTSALGGSYNLGSATNNWCGVCNGGTIAAALALANVDHDITWKANSTANPGHGETPFTVKEIQDGEKNTGVSATVTKYTTKAKDVHEDVLTVIGTCVKCIENGMWVYGPDGGYEEGPGYWSYGTTYTHIVISALDSACGTNYGLYEAPGFAHSVYFTTYLGSENTTWGFHDGGSGSADTNIAPWFALKAGDGNVNAIRRQAISYGWKGISIYDIMYFSPHIINNTITLTLDSYYSLDTIMTFRSSWTPKNNIFCGLHGGDNTASHGDLDIGNFVICVNGTYMICDLGSENYNTVGYFGNYRWSYYRKRAEGHNTLVMLEHGQNWNGKSGKPAVVAGQEKANTPATTNYPTPDQTKNAISKCLRFESGTNSALGVVDMKCAFPQMTEGIRGLYMTDDRSTIIIQDEAKFSKSMDIWWFAHTEGNITISPDGKSATIYRGGITLYAEIVCDNSSAKFTKMSANSLDPSYVGDTIHSDYWTGDTEYSRDSFSKLCINVNNVTELNLAVVFKVVNSADEAPAIGTTYAWTEIKNWKVS